MMIKSVLATIFARSTLQASDVYFVHQPNQLQEPWLRGPHGPHENFETQIAEGCIEQVNAGLETSILACHVYDMRDVGPTFANAQASSG